MVHSTEKLWARIHVETQTHMKVPILHRGHECLTGVFLNG